MKQIVINNISTSYYITEDGRCYNSNTNKWLKGQINYKSGYHSYNLTLPDGTKKRCHTHRLVAQAYIPNNDKNKNQINHIDGNKLNNTAENLEWVTQSENQRHALDNSLRRYNHVYCFNQDKILVAEYKTITEAAKAVNCAISQINQEIHKEVKALTNGFYWSDKPVLGETVAYKNTGRAKPVNQYDKNGKYIATYPSTGAAARALGVCYSHIGECARGKIGSYKGYVWRYVEDIVSPLDESLRE